MTDLVGTVAAMLAEPMPVEEPDLLFAATVIATIEEALTERLRAELLAEMGPGEPCCDHECAATDWPEDLAEDDEEPTACACTCTWSKHLRPYGGFRANGGYCVPCLHGCLS